MHHAPSSTVYSVFSVRCALQINYIRYVIVIAPIAPSTIFSNKDFQSANDDSSFIVSNSFSDI
jgi:hypothetical protein